MALPAVTRAKLLLSNLKLNAIRQWFAGSLVYDRWFALAALGCAGVSAAWWYLQPQMGWRPLLLALAPWLIRLAAGLAPFQTTSLDLPLALFLATAAGSLWLSYNQQAAWAKYWLLIAAVLIFYALAAQPWRNLWTLAVLLGLLGLATALYFLLTHDWQLYPAKVAAVNRAGLRWMAVRPALNLDPIHPNVAAGLIEVLIPFPLAVGLRGWRRRERRRTNLAAIVFGGIVVGFLLLTLLMTTSRGSWIALGIALGLWLLWGLSRAVASQLRQRPGVIFGFSFMALAVVALVFVATYPGGPLALANRLPGPPNAGSRVEIVSNTLRLVGDFSFIGAGLGAFPGAYSQYILMLPTFILGHSHDLFLDVTFEQGPLGLLALIIVLGGSLWLLYRQRLGEKRPRHWSLLRWAVASSLVAMILHGMIDDPLYGSRAALFLFLLPGMAVAVTRLNGWEEKRKRQRRSASSPAATRPALVGAAVILVAIVILFLINDRAILADWYANLGAVEMARVELADWPTNEWDDGRNVAALAPAEALFNQALALDPENRTAHHRLGLIAMLRRDFATAIAHLETAYRLDPNHRGLRKALGYSYAWVGEFDKALTPLQPITEARQEMNIYTWWWAAQGRSDLAERAAVMETRLE